jgi:hypothetical protein
MAGSRPSALVMDDVRARMLRDVGKSAGQAPAERVSRAISTRLPDVLSDMAGRSGASDASGRRSAMEPGSDPARRDMQDVAGQATDFLERSRRAGDVSRPSPVADPKTLGILQAQAPATLRASVFLQPPTILIAPPESERRERALEHGHGKARG